MYGACATPKQRPKPHHHMGVHEHLKVSHEAGSLNRDHGPMSECRLRIGSFLHATWLEVAIILIVSVELVMTCLEAGIDHGLVCLHPQTFSANGRETVACEGKESGWTQLLLSNFAIATKAIVCLFVLEMILKIFVGQAQFFRNPWHVLDLFIITVNVANAFVLSKLAEGTRAEKFAGLLLFLRAWRLIKIFKLVEEEREFAKAQLEEGEQERVLVAARELCVAHGVAIPPALNEGAEDSDTGVFVT